MSSLAVLAERDPALRHLMMLVLKNAGYEIAECSNPLQLKAELYSSPILIAEDALLVLSTDFARQCSSELATVAHVRSSASRTPARFVFTCEFGERQRAEPPLTDKTQLAGVLEKPFDLEELERLALGCRKSRRDAPTNAGSGA